MSRFDLFFLKVYEHLGQRLEERPGVLVGPSCEQWINTEIFLALNWSSPSLLAEDECAFAENRKRDIVIKTRGKVSCVIEVKVIYPWPEKKIRQEKLAIFKRQIDQRMDDEHPDAEHVGLVFLVWDSEMKSRNRKSAELFYNKVYEWVAEEFEIPVQVQKRIQNPILKNVEFAGNTHGINISALKICLQKDGNLNARYSMSTMEQITL